MGTKYFSGDIINNYQILEHISNKNGSYYRCKCSCGNEVRKRAKDITNHIGCKNCSDLSRRKYNIGDSLNNCKIIDYNKTEHKYIFICFCGKKFKKNTTEIMEGNNCCIECSRKIQSEKASLPNGQALKNAQYSIYQNSAKKRGHNFDLSLEELLLLLDQDCFYCGSKPLRKLERKTKYNHNIVFVNGIDRVDNNIGYQANNCVSCCEVCNKAKRMLSIKDFEEWVGKIFLNLKNKGSFSNRVLNENGIKAYAESRMD